MSAVAFCAAPFTRLGAALHHRPQLSVEALAVWISLFLTLFCNTAFFHAAIASGELHGASGAMTLAALFVTVAALNMVLLSAVLTRWNARAVLTVLLPVTALATYYMNHYGVYFDTGMIDDILQTDRREAAELMSPGVIPTLLLCGVLPTVAVWRVRLRPHRSVARALMVRAAVLGLAIAVAICALLLEFQTIAALMRNQPQLRHLITPGNYLVSLERVAFENARMPTPREALGTDASAAAHPAGAKPRLLVLVIGETVRAQNWGLNGYARNTTPQLAQLPVINYPDVTACGTSTEVSLPCMFSRLGRGHYDKQRIKHTESLLHVLEHAGIKTLWRDNQSGCKGVCEGLAFASFEHATTADFADLCDGDRCRDQILLSGLDRQLAQNPGDLVVVLHQLGNHGPSYFQRYPSALRRFTPTCDTAELGQCSTEQIVNAYDNAVLNTDDLLARTIAWLATRDDRDSAMLYVSDHGESLGENGLFLHGMPEAIAPQVQLRVPMVLWLSAGFSAARGVDTACLRRHAADPVSHDNLFHTVLGLMQVRTVARNPDKDLVAACSADDRLVPGPTRR